MPESRNNKARFRLSVGPNRRLTFLEPTELNVFKARVRDLVFYLNLLTIKKNNSARMVSEKRTID